jgi:hypothetical protein
MPRRRLLIGAAVVVAVVAAGLVAAVAGGLLLRDKSQPASVAAALRLFRRDDPNPTGADGVYLYDTTGWESLRVLSGPTHRYPATTTITLTRSGCGIRLRWQPLAARSTTWTLCHGDTGFVVTANDEVHTFYGVTDRTDYRCTGDWPSAATPGTRAAFSCRAAHGRERGVATLVGRGTVTVGDARIQATHIRTTAAVSGENHGTETVDWWIALDSPAPPRIVLSSRTSRHVAIVGTARYREHAVLRLASLKAER